MARGLIRAAASGLITYAGCVALAGAQELCGPLATGERFGDAVVTSVNVVPPGATSTDATPADAAPADATPVDATPAYCAVEAEIRPEPGSRIGAVFRLPERWNGKVLGIGGGGFAGNLSPEAAADGLARGYAVIQNDMGHATTSALDPAFAILPDGSPNVPGVVDFGHRATHLATVAGKAVAERVYGEPPERAYWQGCSTGGRQGLAEVQRYPDDYDGVIAGAPVYTPVTYSNAILRVQAFHGAPGSNLDPAHIPLISAAVMSACDADDGVEDGIITDPRACTWDPAELECTDDAAASDSCLTASQVGTVRRVYDGVRTTDGEFAAMPLMRGGESDWARRMIGNEQMPLGLNALLGAPFMSYIALADPDYDILSFDPDRDMARLNGGLAGAEVHQQDPDITDFVDGGGKLLLWHGFNDPGPSPLSTIEYFEAVQHETPGAADGVRLFLAPGVLHCRGGAGPDQFDALSALEAWVENGDAPERMIATKADSDLTRPLCAYPALPEYDGTGDSNVAESFSCVGGTG